MDDDKKGLSVGVWVAIILGGGSLVLLFGGLCLFGLMSVFLLRSSVDVQMAKVARPVEMASPETLPETSASPEPRASHADAEIWPTEEEAKAAIFKVEYGINASETNKSVWKVKDFRHEVHSVKFANKTTQKQMNYGAPAITVYPAKILYTQITEYEHKDPTRVETGADGVWFLYKDSFGEWTGKYGKE